MSTKLDKQTALQTKRKKIHFPQNPVLNISQRSGWPTTFPSRTFPTRNHRYLSVETPTWYFRQANIQVLSIFASERGAARVQWNSCWRGVWDWAWHGPHINLPWPSSLKTSSRFSDSFSFFPLLLFFPPFPVQQTKAWLISPQPSPLHLPQKDASHTQQITKVIMGE